jgi:regulator of nucleoside diphosphate kinase
MPSAPADLVRPPIVITEAEAEALSALALAAERRSPLVSEMLLDEIERAQVCSADELPADVVTMGANVTFIDEASGAMHAIRLVYPREADSEAGRISILTPLGAGLIGLRAGQSISWPNRAGQHRPLRIVSVAQPLQEASQ